MSTALMRMPLTGVLGQLTGAFNLEFVLGMAVAHILGNRSGAAARAWLLAGAALFLGIYWHAWLLAGLDRWAPHSASFPLLAGAGIVGGILMSRWIEHPLIRMVRAAGRRAQPRAISA
jgi:hypothetical protein